MVPIEEIEESFRRTVQSQSWNSESVFMQKLNLDGYSPEVEEALRQLPENFRAALLLVDVEELSYEEAAEVLNCPLGTLRSRLFRARKLLFLRLREYAHSRHYTKGSQE